jgi:hypothetical protein
LDLSQNNNFPLSADTFSKMEGLRILKFYAPSNQRCTDPYKNLPKFIEPFSKNKLRYFEWNGYPFESLPEPFYAKFLVEIRMPRSNVKQLWQGIQVNTHTHTHTHHHHNIITFSLPNVTGT